MEVTTVTQRKEGQVTEVQNEDNAYVLVTAREFCIILGGQTVTGNVFVHFWNDWGKELFASGPSTKQGDGSYWMIMHLHGNQ